MIGIVGYGGYIPQYRIKAETIANVWGQDANRIINGLGIFEKSVPGKDEDTATIAVEASKNALKRSNVDPQKIGAIFIGSESHPYAVKPTSTIVGEAIGAGPNYTAADTEFACKAGTAALQMVFGMVKGEFIDYGLAVGGDTAQAGEGNALEYSAAAGGTAYLVGRKENEIIAILEKTLSKSSDTPDFWRRSLEPTPEHAGRFTGVPAYFKHVLRATNAILEETNMKASDFTYAVLHQPNGKFPTIAAKKLGFTKEQIAPGLIVNRIGNTYSGSAMLGLASTLDVAKPNDNILVTSYGSGSGSDSFIFRVTEKINEVRNKARVIEDYINRKKYLSYAKYAQNMKNIH